MVKVRGRVPKINCAGCDGKVNKFFWYEGRSLCKSCMEQEKLKRIPVARDKAYVKSLKKQGGKYV